jgi:phosphoribosylamine--glycine ligase
VRILVLGSGAREHAIVLSLLSESHEVVCAPGNAGIAASGATVADLDIEDGSAVTDFARSRAFDLVVIGPEAPLVAGVADPLRQAGFPVFGPSAAAAQIEGSKEFAKRIMTKANVPTGRSVTVTSVQEAEHVWDDIFRDDKPYVVKADGLAAGKGVLVTTDREAAKHHVEQWAPVLLEEFLDGPEVSLFFFSDGTTVTPLTPAQDFKRVFDGDQGPNTGGMGAYSPLPWLHEGVVEEVTRTVAKPTIDQLAAEGAPFIGLLYCGLILTDSGIKVIEFNARFGDPETQVVLARMSSPLGEYLLATAQSRLAELPAPAFSDDSAVIVVLASEGYPGTTITGREITGLDDANAVPGTFVAHAATKYEDGKWIATGGRVLGVVARGETIDSARSQAYEAISHLKLEGGQFRSDIGANPQNT